MTTDHVPTALDLAEGREVFTRLAMAAAQMGVFVAGIAQAGDLNVAQKRCALAALESAQQLRDIAIAEGLRQIRAARAQTEN